MEAGVNDNTGAGAQAEANGAGRRLMAAASLPEREEAKPGEFDPKGNACNNGPMDDAMLRSGHMETARFRTFLEEATIQEGGSHDGMSATVNYEYAMDDLVIAHENIHHDIFSMYTDGQILALLLSSQREKIRQFLGSEIADSYLILSHSILLSSREAHETFATYLSVKTFDSNIQSSQLDRHPSEYRRYYEKLSKVIDPIFRSRNLQYIVALAMSCMTFSSPFGLRFLRQLPHVPMNLIDPEMADNRIDQMIKVIREEARNSSLLEELQAISQETANRLGIELWDLQSDLGWSAVPHWALNKIAEPLGEHIGSWLQERVEFESCYENQEKWDLLVKFAASLGVDMEPIRVDGSDSLSREEGLVLLNASKVGKSIIKNNTLQDLVTAESAFENLDMLHQIGIGATSINETELDFISWSTNAAAPPVCAKITDDILESNRWKLQLTGIKAAVLGVNDYGDFGSWSGRMNYFLRFLRMHLAPSKFAGNQFFYLHGDYAEWLNKFGKPLYYRSFRFESPEFEGVGCIVKIFTLLPGDSTIYMRMLSISAEDHFVKYEMNMMKKDELIEMDDYEERKLSITVACNLCIAMWPEL